MEIQKNINFILATEYGFSFKKFTYDAKETPWFTECESVYEMIFLLRLRNGNQLFINLENFKCSQEFENIDSCSYAFEIDHSQPPSDSPKVVYIELIRIYDLYKKHIGNIHINEGIFSCAQSI